LNIEKMKESQWDVSKGEGDALIHEEPGKGREG
jgi:hypothetical protein